MKRRAFLISAAATLAGLSVPVFSTVLGKCSLRGAFPDRELTVDTTEGPVVGSQAAGRRAEAYIGIPYAKTPVGAKRWKAPRVRLRIREVSRVESQWRTSGLSAPIHFAASPTVPALRSSKARRARLSASILAAGSGFVNAPPPEITIARHKVPESAEFHPRGASITDAPFLFFSVGRGEGPGPGLSKQEPPDSQGG